MGTESPCPLGGGRDEGGLARRHSWLGRHDTSLCHAARRTAQASHPAPTGGATSPLPRVMRPNPAHPEDEGSSLRGLGGYHGSVHLSQPDGGQVTLYYAVGVFSESRPDGIENALPWSIAVCERPIGTIRHECLHWLIPVADPCIGGTSSLDTEVLDGTLQSGQGAQQPGPRCAGSANETDGPRCARQILIGLQEQNL